VHGEHGLVTSVEENASRIGADVLQKGGNAVDAAVAMAFVLAVTHPSAGNIGGGGFMMVRQPSGETYAIDFREVAPARATGEKMMAMIDAGAIGYASTAVPGTVAGLLTARERFGSKPLAELMAPAIRLAEKGHRLTPRAALSLAWQWKKIKAHPETRKIFGRGDKPLSAGQHFKQTDLAKTLKRIADEGRDGFYRGRTAELIAEAMKKNGGDITEKDLAAYEVVVREPLRFNYRGFSVETTPPPSMGGIAIAQILMLLERADAHDAEAGSAESLHFVAEAAKRAYSERRLVGADPAFYPKDMVSDPVARLISERHLATWEPAIDPKKAATSDQLKHDPKTVRKESPETTHFSVVDAEGAAVSCTVTLSASFGSKVTIPKTGLLLSNALGAFSEEGVNDTQPGKRMASSMAPTLVSRDGKIALVVGSPGGDTIPSVVAQVIRNLVDYGMTVDEAVITGRIHHQWMPDRIRAEKATPPSRASLAGLAALGHEVELSPMPLGDANIILVDPKDGSAWGFADRREGGRAVGVLRLGSAP